MFPNLTSDTTQKSELTVTRHCANKLKNRKSFGEGDLVVVYDNFTKTSYDAVVSEVVGTNNYIVQSDNGAKHVSGDVMSARAASSATLPPADATAAADNFDENSIIEDDNLSILSDESEDFELPETHHNNNNNVNNVNNNRRGLRELNNLGPIQNLSRLRSGRN